MYCLCQGLFRLYRVFRAIFYLHSSVLPLVRFLLGFEKLKETFQAEIVWWQLKCKTRRKKELGKGHVWHWRNRSFKHLSLHACFHVR